MQTKGRSKSKVKQSTGMIKKQGQQKQKKLSKEIMKRSQIKQNLDTITKFNMTAVESKKKNKNSGGGDTTRSISPLCTNSKKSQVAKNDDQKFIEKLFSQNIDQLAKVFFIQDLIQGLVPFQKKNIKTQPSTQTPNPSIDILKELHLKNQQVATLQQELQELKLYVSNFTFKVFDLTVLCRKYSAKLTNQDQNLEFNRSTDQVIAYLDSLVRHWKLQSKMKSHCENISKRISIPSQKNKIEDVRKRCHTQSLKIPIQQYLQSLQNTGNRKLFQKQKQKKDCEQQPSQQIMKILSRRSSGRKKQQQQTYVVLKEYKAKNQNQLDLRPGESISVLQKNGNQRWLGYKQGKIGYFQKQCLF